MGGGGGGGERYSNISKKICIIKMFGSIFGREFASENVLGAQKNTTW